MNKTGKTRELIYTALKLILHVYAFPFLFMSVGDYISKDIAFTFFFIVPLIFFWIYFFGKRLVARMVQLRKEIDEENS